MKLIPADGERWTEEVGVFLQGVCLSAVNCSDPAYQYYPDSIR